MNEKRAENANKNKKKERQVIIMLGLAIFGAVLLGSAIRCGIDNKSCKSRGYGTTTKGEMISFDRKGGMCVNGERVETRIKMINGKMYTQEVGVKTGKVYMDSRDEETYALLLRNEIAKQMAKEDGALAYYSYEPDLCNEWNVMCITREISTHKTIARLEENKGKYKKYYKGGDWRFRSDIDDNDEGIEISKEEFEKLNLIFGSHSVYSPTEYLCRKAMPRGDCNAHFNITDEEIDNYIEKILKDETLADFLKETFEDKKEYIKRAFAKKYQYGYKRYL